MKQPLKGIITSTFISGNENNYSGRASWIQIAFKELIIVYLLAAWRQKDEAITNGFAMVSFDSQIAQMM